ncbi:MAG: M18 family aminopeptidase [Gammaproteobacteria bacterium]|nr:MAG: M18 family aminopeptidase [Gammaproteobacteria bacterium]
MNSEIDYNHIKKLLNFIDSSPSPWHACSKIAEGLEHAGYHQLFENETWNLEKDHGYYVIRDDSSIIAFKVGNKPLHQAGFRCIGAHVDSPTLRIKPNPVEEKSGINRLGVETYGGAILATFTDRDLSLAGRIVHKDNNNWLGCSSKLINLEDPLLRIPNLAIHMNREVNEKGLKLDKQAELPLILGNISDSLPGEDKFKQMLSEKSGIDNDDIISWELSVYDTQKAALYGAESEFFASRQIDNLASCHAAVSALLASHQSVAATNVCAFFDHEEVGSNSIKGADGSFISDILHRIAITLGCNDEQYKIALAQSFMISADMSHAYHPNFPQFYDDNHKILVNHGPAIKINANQRYTSTAVTEAFFIRLCEAVDVPYQKYVHRTNLPCGSTIGPMVAAQLGIKSVDIGNPMWSMHSIRESAGVLDHNYLTSVLDNYFAGN